MHSGLTHELCARPRRHWLVFLGLGGVLALIIAVDPSKLVRAFAGASS